MYAGIEQGYVDIAVGKATDGGGHAVTGHTFFDLGAEREQMFAYVESHADKDLYFTPCVYSQPLRSAEDDGAQGRFVYADADTFDPRDARLAPSVVVETSPGHWHAYWELDDVTPQAELVRLSTRITRAHHLDHSSGIATKLLRIPGTANTKYGTAYTVSVLQDSDDIYFATDVERAYNDVPDQQNVQRGDADFPGLGDLFDAMGRVPDNARIAHLLSWDKRNQDGDEAGKRSERRYELVRLLLEAGLTPQEVLTVVWSTPLADKFREQNRGPEDLWRFDVLAGVAREEAPRQLEPVLNALPPVTEGFITEQELEQVFSSPGIISRWEENCYSALHPRTPNQYIRLNGYFLLAATLGNKVAVMPPGTNRAVFCNVYAINLGPTTTGKTEALLYMERYIDAFSHKVGYDLVVGSNATAEGLIKALKSYDKRTAMLVTDEVSAKFRQWQTSAAMSHAREAELSIYDGKLPKNLRAGDGAGNTENVYLSFSQYMMGVDSEVEKILDRGFLRSGYIPRCLIVKAEAAPFDVNEHLSMVQGDPDRSQDVDPEPAKWAERFAEVVRRNLRRERNGKTVMQFTDEAWARFLEFRARLLLWASEQDDPDVYRPHAIRFAVSCQKLMALLAYERLSERIELQDVLHVLHDAEAWWGYTTSLIHNVSDSEFARAQDEVLTWLDAKGGSARLSQFHEKFKSSTPRERSELLESLEARNALSKVTAPGKPPMLEIAR